MKATKQTKTFGIVLSLAAGGLFVDRVFLGSSVSGPESAAAEGLPDVPPPTGGAETAGAPKPDPAGRREAEIKAVLATNLEFLREHHKVLPGPVADAFALPDGWVVKSTKPSTTVPTRTADQDKLPRITAIYTLVIDAKPVDVVIADGKRMFIGDHYESLVLDRIERPRTGAVAVFISVSGRQYDVKPNRTGAGESAPASVPEPSSGGDERPI